MGDIPRQELMAGLQSLHLSAEYADLKLVLADGSEIVAHKAIVCPRTPFFAKCVKNEAFKEGIEGKIELPDDEPEIVRYMMEYLYCLDYTPPALVDADTQSLAESHNSAMLHGIPDGQFFGSSAFEQPASPFGGFMPPDGRRSARRMADRRNPSAAPEPSPLATATPHLVLHAKMYSIADKYGISGLKSLALDKFKIQLTKHWNNDEFCEAIHVVYTSTPSSDRDMRSSVADVFDWHDELLDKPEIEVTIMEITGLAYELLKRSRRARRAIF